MNYNDYAKRAYETAKAHGFHDKPFPLAHYLMLTITEVSEMVEADRKGRHAQRAVFECSSVSPQPEGHKERHWKFCYETFIKDTFEDEMADACIRLFDLAGAFKWEIKPLYVRIEKSNYKNSFVNSVTDHAYYLCELLCSGSSSCVISSIAYLLCWAKALGIDLDWHIEQKMKYNEMRPPKHGKKY